MPRQRRSAAPRSAPVRPSPSAARPQAPAHQGRSMSTTAPSTKKSQPPAQSSGGGLFGQMASTAAGVAVGSSIGHAIGGFFGSSGSQEVAQGQNQPSAMDQHENSSSNTWGTANCEGSALQFTKCMDENSGNMQICSWYLDQLKACQAAAKQY